MSWLDVPGTYPIAEQQTASLLVAPLVAGWVANLLLFGLFISNFYQYCSSTAYERDAPKIKVMLWTVLWLGVAQVGCNIEELGHFACSQQRDTFTLLNGGFGFNFQPIFGGLVAGIVQAFLIKRAGFLFGSTLQKTCFFILLGSMVLTSLAGAMLCAALGFLSFDNSPNIDYVLPISFSVAAAIWLWPAAICDMLLSLALYIQLSRRKHGFNTSTDSMISALIRVALRTASYTAFVALTGAIISSIIPSKNK